MQEFAKRECSVQEFAKRQKGEENRPESALQHGSVTTRSEGLHAVIREGEI